MSARCGIVCRVICLKTLAKKEIAEGKAKHPPNNRKDALPARLVECSMLQDSCYRSTKMRIMVLTPTSAMIPKAIPAIPTST
jgi:hypothetical protein